MAHSTAATSVTARCCGDDRSLHGVGRCALTSRRMPTDLVRAYLLGLQQRIVGEMERLDGGRFVHDAWMRAPGERLQGDGLTRCIDGGELLERGGCNFSHVRGPALPPSATQHRPELAGAGFEAMGVSLVLHPRNPLVPTVHMNVRMFAAQPVDGGA